MYECGGVHPVASSLSEQKLSRYRRSRFLLGTYRDLMPSLEYFKSDALIFVCRDDGRHDATLVYIGGGKDGSSQKVGLNFKV